MATNEIKQFVETMIKAAGPKAHRQEVSHRFVHEIQKSKHRDLLAAILLDWITDARRFFPASATDEADDMPGFETFMPNGKPLAECTREDLQKFGEAYLRIAPWQEWKHKTLLKALENKASTPMLDYLPAGPVPKAIPAGKILVHNFVRPSKRIGNRGFRAWWDDKGNEKHWQECDCGWGPGKHFKTRR